MDAWFAVVALVWAGVSFAPAWCLGWWWFWVGRMCGCVGFGCLGLSIIGLCIVILLVCVGEFVWFGV